MPTASGSFWSAWADDFAAERHPHLDCRRRHRSAARLHRAERGGANGVGKRAVLGACVRLPRPTRRSDQAVVVGWRWTLSIRQAFGTRPFHLAAGRRGRGMLEPRATVV